MRTPESFIRVMPLSSSVCARTTSTPLTAVRAWWAMCCASVTMTITIRAATKTTTSPSASPTYQPVDAAMDTAIRAIPPSLCRNPLSWQLPCQLLSRAHLVDAAARSGQAAAVAAISHGDELGHDRHRRLLRGDAAEVEADRRCNPLQLRVGHARRDKPLTPPRLRAPAAHRADVGRVGVQRRQQGGIVQLRVVCQHREIRRAVDPADVRECLGGPLGDNCLGFGEALR